MKDWEWGVVGLSAAAVGAGSVWYLRRSGPVAATRGSRSYALQAALAPKIATVPGTGSIQQDAIALQWTTLANGSPLPNQTLQVSIQRASGADQRTLKTNAKGQASLSLWTAHGQTMTVTAQWTDPSGQSHFAILRPQWNGPAAPSTAPSQVAYHLALSVSSQAIQLGQTVQLTIEPSISWVANGGHNGTILGNQTVHLSGGLGTQPATTAIVPNLPSAIQLPAGLGQVGKAIVITVTPSLVGTLTETITWTDPAGTQHQHQLSLKVTAAAPSCPPTLIGSQPLPLPSWIPANAQNQITVAQVHPQCPAAYAAISTIQNGATQHYIVVVAGVQTAAQLIQYLQSIGWQHVQIVQGFGTGTIGKNASGTATYPVQWILNAAG